MTFKKAREIVLRLLQKKGTVKNSATISILGEDRELFEAVREDLIFSDLAEDKTGSHLVYIGSETLTHATIEGAFFREEPQFENGHTDTQHIFISYGRKDAAEFAARLAEWLRSQGYEPWLDIEKGIPVGTPFDIRIEHGISNCRMLIALLSPWSLREEGFCRNELLFAQSRGVPIIPARIAEIHPPIQIISLNYIDASENPERIFEELPRVLDEVRRRGRMSLRDWPSLRGGGAWWKEHRPIHFEEELARYGGSFVGRQWLFKQLRSWADRPDARLLLLIADAGVGKSSIAAQLTTRLDVQGVHFCTRSNIDSCSASAWIRALVYQLAAQFPAYSEKLAELGVPSWSDPPESLLRTLVTEPMLKCREERDNQAPLVFVIDGLDEAAAARGPELPDLLADSVRRLPEWFRLIVTTRPDLNLLARFGGEKPGAGIWPLRIEAGGEENSVDLHRYIRLRVGNDEILAQHEQLLLNRLPTLAAGNFLFAEMTLNALSDPNPEYRLSPDDLGALPGELERLYHHMFRKRFMDPIAYDQKILPLLDCLVAAQDPLPEELVKIAVGVDRRTAQRGLSALSQFLVRDERGVSLFHKSVSDWLMNESVAGRFTALSLTGHERLADACWLEYQKGPGVMSRYPLAHLPAHLIGAGRWQDLETVLTDLKFIETKCAAGMTYDLVTDYYRALETLPEAQDGKKQDRERNDRIGRYTSEMIDYAKAWNDARTRYATDPVNHPLPAPGDIPLPEITPSVRFRTDKDIDAEFHRIILNPTRLDRVRVFARFVNSQTNALSRFASQPMFCIQQAHNSADSGPVVLAAQKALELPYSETLLLRTVQSLPKLLPHPVCLRTLEGHDKGVRSVSVTPDAQIAVSGSYDNTLRVWDLETGACLQTLAGHNHQINSVSVTPDGRVAVSGSTDKTLRVWDLENGRGIHTLNGHSGWVNAVSVTPDGRRAASGSADKTVRVWDLDNGRCIHTLEGHTERVSAVNLTPDGRSAVSGSKDATLRVWDLEVGRCIHTLKMHNSHVGAVSVTPDGRSAVSGSDDKMIRVWDLETGRCIQTLEGHRSAVFSVNVTPDGRRAVSGSWDRTIRVWDLETGRCIQTLEGHSSWVGEVSITPDARRAVSGSRDKTLMVWDLETGCRIKTVEGHSSSVRTVSATPDGCRAVSGSYDNTLRVWNLETACCVHILEGHHFGVSTATVVPDGRRVISGSNDKTLRVWDLETGCCIRTLVGHSAWVRTVSVTPDGYRAVSGANDKTLRLWDLETGSCIHTLCGHRNHVGAVSITPDGRMAISGSYDNTLRVWDFEIGRCIRILEGHSNHVVAVCATPEGRRAVSGSYDKTLRVWDLEIGRCIRILEGHSDAIRTVSVTADGLRAVSGSYDNTLRVWDLETGHCLAVFSNASAVLSLSTGGKDGMIVAGTMLGEVIFLLPRNVPYGPSILTVSRFLQQPGSGTRRHMARCPVCRSKFEPDEDSISTIDSFCRSITPHQSPCLDLPASAFTDSRLRSDCPHCAHPVRFNPFFVDHKDQC